MKKQNYKNDNFKSKLNDTYEEISRINKRRNKRY